MERLHLGHYRYQYIRPCHDGAGLGVFAMRTPQTLLATITETTANLKAELRELDRLRERIGKAQLLARRVPRINRRDTH
jgi:hypothetical protein